jgi:hypothetical protein
VAVPRLSVERLIPTALPRAADLLGGGASDRNEGRGGTLFPVDQAIEGFGEAINRLFHLLDQLLGSTALGVCHEVSFSTVTPMGRRWHGLVGDAPC